MPETDLKIDLAWRTFLINQENVRNADTKIFTLLIINGVFITFALSDILKSSHNLYQTTCIIIFSLSFILFLYFCLQTVFARGLNKTRKAESNIFFADISSHAESNEYLQYFNKTNKEQFLEDILKQTYILSKIALKKYSNVNKAWICLGIEAIAFLLNMAGKLLM
jgi:hypothetical protein